MSGSPLVFDDLVVVNPGGPHGKAVVAYERRTGDLAWSAGNDEASYASPQLGELEGVRQILSFDAVGIAGHAPDDGRELWKFPWTNGPKANAAQPIVLGSDRLFIGNGYSVGSAVLMISRAGDKWSASSL